MYLSVELGEYKCSNRVHTGVNDHTKCAIMDSDGNQAMPPVEITVDFGDGSGEQVNFHLNSIISFYNSKAQEVREGTMGN